MLKKEEKAIEYLIKSAEYELREKGFLYSDKNREELEENIKHAKKFLRKYRIQQEYSKYR